MVNGFRAVGEREAATNWDHWLSAFEYRGIRQSHAWSRHKTGGWTPERFAWFDNGKPTAMSLVLTRRAPLGAGTVAWANAGPVFRDLPALDAFLHGLTAHFARIPRSVVRMAPRVPRDPELEAVLAKAGFTPARASLDSGHTVVLDITKNLEQLRAGLDRKWRNQLKKADTFSPVFEFGRERPLIQRFLALHQETRARKNLKDGIDLTTLERAARDFGPALTFAVGSTGDKDGCALSWWSFSGRATLWLAAAGETGMAACLPNAAYWAAITRLKAEGAASFDLSGIDAKLNPGVTHFKLGVGGTELVTPGEWDWSAHPLPRAIFNIFLGVAPR